jgi:hypothetical protein
VQNEEREEYIWVGRANEKFGVCLVSSALALPLAAAWLAGLVHGPLFTPHTSCYHLAESAPLLHICIRGVTK